MRNLQLRHAALGQEEVGRMGGRGGNRRGGQSTLEYILVVAAILVAVIAAAGSLIRPAVEEHMMQDAADTIEAATGELKTGLGL